MFRAANIPRWYVQQSIQALIRTFPSERLRIFRHGAITGVDGLGQQTYAETVVFEGEALYIPETGDVARYGLGQVEEDKPRMLVSGWHPIMQGDFVTRQERLPGGAFGDPRPYQIEYPPNHWHAFTVITLANYGQGR